MKFSDKPVEKNHTGCAEYTFISIIRSFTVLGIISSWFVMKSSVVVLLRHKNKRYCMLVFIQQLRNDLQQCKEVTSSDPV